MSGLGIMELSQSRDQRNLDLIIAQSLYSVVSPTLTVVICKVVIMMSIWRIES